MSAGPAKPPPAHAKSAGEPPVKQRDPSVLERVLNDRSGEARRGALCEATVAAWSEASGSLEDGRVARLAASCLLRPAPGDRVLIWIGDESEPSTDVRVLSVIERSGNDALVLAASRPLAIKAPSVGVSSETMHIVARDFLTNTRNRHAVEDTRTETVRVRVAQVGADIRRADTVDEDVSGTFLQRAGTWISNTAREARLKARTFLFD